MADKKAPIFTWFVTMVGLLGSIYIIFMITRVLYLYFFAKGEEAMGMLGIVVLPYCIPFPILLFFGIRRLIRFYKLTSN
jgi:hypothetical protein